MHYGFRNRMMVSSTLIAVLALSACKGGVGPSSSFIKTVDVNLSTQNSNTFINLISTFDLGGSVSLAEMNVDIPDPRDQVVKGGISFSQLPGGVGQITVSMNTSLIPNASTELGQTLPNGKLLPSSLAVKPGQVLGIKVLEHSVAYLGGNTDQVAYAGVALAIKGFDQVMNQLPVPANLFYLKDISPSVLGVGGIYGSTTEFESGIAIFGRYTNPSTQMAQSVELKAQNAKADYEIEKLNLATFYRLKKFFTKKKNLRFY